MIPGKLLSCLTYWKAGWWFRLLLPEITPGFELGAAVKRLKVAVRQNICPKENENLLK
jgi:hypothetical protein